MANLSERLVPSRNRNKRVTGGGEAQTVVQSTQSLPGVSISLLTTENTWLEKNTFNKKVSVGIPLYDTFDLGESLRINKDIGTGGYGQKTGLFLLGSYGDIDVTSTLDIDFAMQDNNSVLGGIPHARMGITANAGSNSDVNYEARGVFRIQTRQEGANGILNDALTIDWNQNVGIGTNLPTDRLTLFGGTNIPVVLGLNSRNEVGQNQIVSQIVARNVDIISSINFYRGSQSQSGGIDFYTKLNNASYPVFAMRIGEGGNVGIGVTNPTALVHTKGAYTYNSALDNTDYTAVVGAQLKIEATATTSGYWRVPHISTDATVSGVYNYQTGKNVYWGEPTDTGTYHFMGRRFIVGTEITSSTSSVFQVGGTFANGIPFQFKNNSTNTGYGALVVETSHEGTAYILYCKSTGSLPGKFGVRSNGSILIGGQLYTFPSNTATAGQVLTNNGSNLLSWTTVTGSGGGTGITQLNGATDSTQYLAAGAGISIVTSTNNTHTISVTSSGTVTSVGLSVPVGLSVSGSPVTTSGTLAISLAMGYTIPTAAAVSNGVTAYGWGNHASAGYLTAQVYPGAGIAISTGSAWGTSIANNSGNWNTAYSWGNHASAGYTSNVGTVTSVGLSVPTGLSIANSPITSSGTLAISLASGYSIPTTTKQGNWDTAYNNRISTLTVSGHGAASFTSNVLNIPNYAPSFHSYGTVTTTLAWNATTYANASVTINGNTAITISGLVDGMSGTLFITEMTQGRYVTIITSGFTKIIDIGSPTTTTAGQLGLSAGYYYNLAFSVSGTVITFNILPYKAL